MTIDYFSIAETMYNQALPHLINFSMGNFDVRLTIRILDSISFEICQSQFGEDWSCFLSTYYACSFSKGDYNNKLQMASFAPHWMYVAESNLCKHLHGEFNGLVLPYNDSLWNTHYPPNSWKCGCWIRIFTDNQLKEQSYKSYKEVVKYFVLNPPFDINFAKREWSELYKKLFIQHFVTMLFEHKNYELNEEDEE